MGWCGVGCSRELWEVTGGRDVEGDLDREEDVFDAIKIGLDEYRSRLPQQSPAAAAITLEVTKMENGIATIS